MSARSESYAAVFSKDLRRYSSKARQSVRQEARELFEEAKVGRRSAEASAKPKGKVSVVGPIGRGGRNAPPVAKRKAEDVLAVFDSDVQLKSAVERARNRAISADLTERERRLDRFKRAAADSPKSVKAVLSFGLEQEQVQTLEQLLGQLFGRTITKAGTKEMRKAQDTANKLVTAMKGHWDAALPKGETRSTVLRSVFDELQAAFKRDPNLNPSKFVRAKLFNEWRKRFMKRLGADRALVADLRAATGIDIVTDAGVPRFSLKLKVGKTQVEIGFDVDHAETRLTDAVRNAKRPEDLLSVIDSEGMQLLTPRENRIQIEALRKATREYFDEAEEAVGYFRRAGVEATALNREIDELLDALDRPGEVF